MRAASAPQPDPGSIQCRWRSSAEDQKPDNPATALFLVPTRSLCTASSLRMQLKGQPISHVAKVPPAADPAMGSVARVQPDPRLPMAFPLATDTQ